MAVRRLVGVFYYLPLLVLCAYASGTTALPDASADGYLDGPEDDGARPASSPRAYVINLEHRPERLGSFVARLEKDNLAPPSSSSDAPPSKLHLNYTVLRASNHTDASAALSTGSVRVDPTFVGSGTGGRRGMTLGEVGCAMSHVRVWQRIAEELDSDDSDGDGYALVLEDDAVLSSDFANRIPSIMSSAASTDVDFVYLAYRPRSTSSGGNASLLTPGLQTCVQSWWTLGYMIRPKAAKRLADHAEIHYLTNLIPVDEYLPMVLVGTTEEDDEDDEARHRYPDLPMLGCAAVTEPQIAEPADDREGESGIISDTEVSDLAANYSPEQRTSLVVYTVATDPNHFGYVSLKRSADFYGYVLINLAENIAQWGGYLWKLELVRDALLERGSKAADAADDDDDNAEGWTIDDDTPILFVDGYDTLFQVGPEKVVRRFEVLEGELMGEASPEDSDEEGKGGEEGKEGGLLLFGAERYCWPSQAVCDRYHDENADDDPYPYLNSGTYMGRAGTLRSALADVGSATDHDDDQRYFSEMLADYVQSNKTKTGGPRILLDSDHVLFQPLLGLPRSDWYVQGTEWGTKFELRTNKEGGSKGVVVPAVLHGQGPSKFTLVGLSNYLAGAYSTFYGTKRHQYRAVRADGDDDGNGDNDDVVYPLTIGLFFTAEAEAAGGYTDVHTELFLEGVASLDVDWSRTSLFVYYAPDLKKIDRRAVDDALDRLGAKYYDLATETDEALARAEFLSTYSEADKDGVRAGAAAALALMLDSDVIVRRPSLVTDLAGWTDRPIIAGHAQRPGKLWSNYWTDMDHYAGEGWYVDGFDTTELYLRERKGLFQVPLVRSVVLVRRSELGRLSDLFAANAGAGADSVRRTCKAAIEAGLPMYVDNRYNYASIVDPDVEFRRADYPVAVRATCGSGSVEEESQVDPPALSGGPSLRIPRERNLSLRDFYEKYADTQTPVIIEDYSSVFGGMTVDNLLRECGHVDTKLAHRTEKEGKWAKVEWVQRGSLRDAVTDICEQTKSSKDDTFRPVEGSIVGVFDWSLQRHCPGVLEKHFVVPKYLSQDFLQRVPHDEDLYYRDYWPSLFIGVNGTYGANHKDVFGSNFWMYVIDGTKEWHLVDSVDDSDFFGHDANAITRHFHDIVKKGELLIVPGDRWHQVRNWGTTVTIAGNFVSRGSYGTMKREVERDGQNSGAYYRQLEDTLLSPDFDTSISYDQGDMSWLEYRSQSDSQKASKNGTSFDNNECEQMARHGQQCSR